MSPSLHAYSLADTSLRSLEGNDLGPDGGKALAEALKINTTLTRLQ